MEPRIQLESVDWASFLTGEFLAAGVLGKVLYTYPDREWLQSLADEEIFAEAPLGNAQTEVQEGLALLQSWTRAMQDSASIQVFEALRADYTRLLVGPGQVIAPPWESVYGNDERLVFQQKTLEVRAWYQRFGLKVPDLHKEPDDHIGLEFVFVGHLAQEALAALDRQDLPALGILLTAQRDFLSEHLLKWTPLWCSLVKKEAQTEFMRGIALLTEGVLAEIATVLRTNRIAENVS